MPCIATSDASKVYTHLYDSDNTRYSLILYDIIIIFRAGRDLVSNLSYSDTSVMPGQRLPLTKAVIACFMLFCIRNAVSQTCGDESCWRYPEAQLPESMFVPEDRAIATLLCYSECLQRLVPKVKQTVIIINLIRETLIIQSHHRWLNAREAAY